MASAKSISRWRGNAVDRSESKPQKAVVAALAKQLRAVLAQMALEIAAFNRR